MKLKKSMLAAGVVTTVAAGSFFSLNAASAATTDGSSSIIDKLVNKFGLNRDEVEAVFDEQHAEHQADRAAKFSDRLQDKVDSGDITAEQKTLIEQKFSELQTALETERELLEKWADENDIKLRHVMGGHGRMGGSQDLDNAVADGDITAEQKSLIQQKREELESARKTVRDELEQWAENNNIELSNILPMGRGMGGHVHGIMGGHR